MCAWRGQRASALAGMDEPGDVHGPGDGQGWTIPLGDRGDHRRLAIMPDRAGWHWTKDLAKSANITLVAFPSYSAELNPSSGCVSKSASSAATSHKVHRSDGQHVQPPWLDLYPGVD
jgi:hypothetical protein